MSWFHNMKIRSKLIFGFSIVILLAVIMAIFAIIQLSNVSTEYNIIIDGAVARRGAVNAVQSNVRGYRRVVTSSVMVAPLDYAERSAELAALLIEAEAMRNEIWAQLDLFEESARNEPGQTAAWRQERIDMSAGARDLFDQYRDVFLATQEYAHAGNHQAAYNATIAGRNLVNELIRYTDEMVALANMAMDDGVASAAATANSALMLILAITLIVVVVAVVLALIVSQAITSPVKNLVKLTGQVADGQLNINIDRSRITRDEIGDLTTDVYTLIDTIRGIVDDIGTFSREVNKNGDIDFRIDPSRYRGGYGEMVVSLNDFASGFVDDLVNIADVLNKVGDGDFNIKLAQLPGKKAQFNDAVDSLRTNLEGVYAEVNAMIDAAANKGDMHFHVDPNRYKGDWSKIIHGLNLIAEAVDAPIIEIRDVMGNLAKGDFSKNVSGNYKGDFLDIKVAVNDTIATLQEYINEIAEILSRIASGDLTVSVARDYVGSFSAIKDSLNNISGTLNKTMSEISSASDQVLSGAKQISTSAMDLANGATQQAASVEELNSSVDLINQQTQANATNANEANNLSNTSTSNAREGNEAMQQTLGAMNEIKDASNNISKIIRTIQDIAFQTNLLALNAAVEAARAGEHGKGFAVVAEEVRSLAARSQEAASETTTLIGTSISTVDSGAEIARTTAETLDTIVENATKVLEVVTAISSASQEQAEAISQVVIGLNQISQVVQSNSAVSEEAAAASEELTSQAEILQQLVSYFKV
ncbi:MAG: methyl-accepting chemotaxis protein [Defluviitaleaceae bacterium]|nr:methyl-accepting chemotaxis protein [Defluviitaleaceae bacterium]